MRPLLLLGERPGADLPTLSSQPDQRMPFPRGPPFIWREAWPW